MRGSSTPKRGKSTSNARLPLVELPDLLMEVDGWTGFSRHLEHAGGAEPRAPELLAHCHASILAQACNFGLTRMAQLADLSYRQLAWYLREETLKPAIAGIVNRHYRHPLARLWGGGTLSSSDGQRFPMTVRSQTATAIPRYFGYGRGLTFTWTSDQFSQYGSKPIPSTVRDSTYVLDGVLDNETELPIAEHTTDTAGYTDLVFGFFDLLGLQFSPRLRDLADQTLYRIDKSIRYQHIGLLVRGAIKPRLFLAHWDDLLRAAGSLKLGWVTASLLIAKLQSSRRKNVLTRALQEYGRLNKRSSSCAICSPSKSSGALERRSTRANSKPTPIGRFWTNCYRKKGSDGEVPGAKERQKRAAIVP